MDLAWSELVLHVLAHLSNTAELPSSLYAADYLRAATLHLGEVSERPLAADIAVLSSQLTTHEHLAGTQLVARLHPSLAAARRTQHLDLAALIPDADTDIAIRDCLLTQCPVTAELLRCAALLEAPHFQRWPLPHLEDQQRKLERVLPFFGVVAPRLRQLPVRMLRVLGLRGRAWLDAIWVGIPVPCGLPSWSHVLWQACHEATVLEVADGLQSEQPSISERSVERVAVALLARRAANAHLTSGHVSWLSRMAPETRVWTQVCSLSREERQWLDQFV